MANLFRNTSFAALTDWTMTADGPEVARVEGQSADWKLPRFTQTGSAAVVELNWGPFWCAVYQAVSGLTIGAVYKIAFDVQAEMKHPELNSQPASDPLSVEARLKAGPSAGPFNTGAVLAYGVPVTLSATYTAQATTEVMGIELRARHSLYQNRFTLSNPSLILISSPSPTTPPTTPPAPVVVGEYDVLTNLTTGLVNDLAALKALSTRAEAGLDALTAEVIRLRERR